MATVTHLGTATWVTTGGNTTVVATPAVGDLIVVVAATSGIAAGTTNVSDDNAGTAQTYSKVSANFTGFSTTGVLSIWIRDNFIATAASTTFTATQASSTGGGLDLFKVTGMLRAGTSAARQTAGQSAGTLGTTPAPVFGSAALTANAVIGAIANGTSPATLTPRGTPVYTEATDLGYATPTTGLETMFISSGETASTITWGSTSATAFASCVVELDTSTPLTVADLPGALLQNDSVPQALYPGLGRYF